MIISNTRFQRIIAFIVDAIFALLVATLVVWFLADALGVPFNSMFRSERKQDTRLIYLSCYLLLSAVEFLSPRSVGKVLLGIEVIASSRLKISFFQLLSRWTLKNLPVIFVLAFYLITKPGADLGWLICGVTFALLGHLSIVLPMQLTVYELFTGTQVVFPRDKVIPQNYLLQARAERQAANF